MNKADQAFRSLFLGSDLMESVLSARGEPAELERLADRTQSGPKRKVMSAEDVMAIALGQVQAPVGAGSEVTAAPQGAAVPPPEETDLVPPDAFAARAVSAEERAGLAPSSVPAPEPPTTLMEAPAGFTSPRAPQAPGPESDPAGLLQPARIVERFETGGVAGSGPEIDRLARSIAAHRFEYGPSVIFTSASSGEGKTALAAGVALASARSGTRTVLIDASLAGANATRMIAPEPGAGLVDLLDGTVDFAGVLVRSEAEGLWMIPAIGGMRSEGAVLASDEAAALVSRLHRLFDLVVIDGPSLAEEPAVAGLAAMSGGVVIAIKSRSTTRLELERAIEELESAGARIMGLALTYVPGSAGVEVGAAALP